MKLPTTVEEIEEFLQVKEEFEHKILKIGSLVNYRLYEYINDYSVECGYIHLNTDDYWSDGTHDYESVSFPVEYLTLTDGEIFEKELEKQERARLQKEERERIEKEEQLKVQEEKERAEYERLKAKFEK